MATLGLMLALLAGCSSQPHFVDAISVPEPGEGTRLVVVPVDGIGPDVGRALGEDMAWGLREAGYPAHFADTPTGQDPYVRGEVGDIEIGSQVVWLGLRWLIYSADGRVQGIHRHQVAVSLDDWTAVSPRTLTMIVAEAVPAVHERAAPLVFPGGVKPNLAVSPGGEGAQFASIGVSGNTDTIVISGDGLAIVGPNESFETAQFDPVFEPAAVDVPEPAAGSAQPEIEPESVFYAPAPQKPATPELITLAPKTSTTKTEPVNQMPSSDTSDVSSADFDAGPAPPEPPTGTFIDVAAIEALSGSLVESEAIETPSLPAVVEPVSDEPRMSTAIDKPASGGASAISPEPAESPFSRIADNLTDPDDPEMLTPEAAALVTTDPWLTIAEPVAMPRPESEVLEPAADAEARAEPIIETVVVETPPPPQPPEALAVEAESAAQTSVMDTVIEPEPELEFEPEPNQPAQTDTDVGDAIQVASGSVSAGELDQPTPAAVDRPVFVVRPVLGAPGDGNSALGRAVRAALRKIDAAVTEDAQQATHVLQGSVRVDSPFAGRQKVRIVWQVTAIDGTVTGQALQENQVPQGSLDGVWGPTADAVATGAVKGIEKLFDSPISGTATSGLSQPDLPHVGND